jgi:hypothetical protein
MKNRLLCLCVVLSLCVFASGKAPQTTKDFSAPQTFRLNNQIGNSEIPNVFRPIGNFFKRLFGKKRNYIREYPNPNVKRLTLLQNRTVIVDSTIGSMQTNGCAKKSRSVEVLTKANEAELENQLFNYRYKVTAGKIIGEGANVIWDLSGVAPGTYRIMAEVDNGCGWSCGQSITVEICVAE